MRSFRSLSSDTGMLGWLWVSVVVIFLDQFTKWMAESSLVDPGNTFMVLPHVDFTLSYNPGAAFSFLGGQDGWQRWFFAALAIIVCVFIVNWLRRLKKRQVWAAVGLALVLGGAIGNLIDRLLYGKVIDFVAVYFDIPFVMENYHFAIFNVADMAITGGAILLVFLSLFAEDQID